MGNIVLSIIFFIIIGILFLILTAPIFAVNAVFLGFLCNLNNKKYTDFQKRVHLNIVFTLILGLLLIISITPISESLNCNDSKTCTLTTGYFIPFLNRIEELKLNNNSYIDIIKKEHYRSTANHTYELNSIEFYHALHNSSSKRTQLFRSNSAELNYFDLKEGKKNALSEDIKRFESYKQNYTKSYHINSALNNWNLNLRIFWWTLIMIILMFWNLKKDRKEFIEDLIHISRPKKLVEIDYRSIGWIMYILYKLGFNTTKKEKKNDD